jgi:hypothetical protein
MTLTDLQMAGIITAMFSVIVFIAMHWVKNMRDRMVFLYVATFLGCIATVIGILT